MPENQAAPVGISEGRLRIGEAEPENLIELPLNSTEAIDLRLELANAALLEIVGRGLKIEAAGEARFIEDLPEDIRPKES